MHRLGSYCFFIILFFSYNSGSSQTFPCEGNLILSTQTSNTSTYKIVFGPFGAVYYNPLTVYLEEGFDALGFNPKDNYIYGVHKDSKSVVRLRSDGSYEILGTDPSIDSLNAFAGDCTPGGLYLCHDNELDKILVFEVQNNFSLVNQLDLYWDPSSVNSGPFTTRIDDLVVDPNNPGIAYAFQGHYGTDDFDPFETRGYLLRINIDFADPNVGMVTPVAFIPSDIVLQLGSLFFTDGGQLFGLGPYTNGPFIQSRLISINPFNGNAIIQGITTPQAPMSDGCSCPYSLSFSNDIVPRDVTCNSSELSFVLRIINRSNEELSNLIINDTIPEGMVIQSVTGDFDGNIAAGTGIGTRILTIENLNILPKESVVITINANVIDIPVGLIPNQAVLTNLPTLFGDTKISDDPQTPGFVGDVSQFFSAPQPIENVAVEVTPPSNCLNPFDAQMLVSSPSFIAETYYQVRLINQETWDEFNYTVFINTDNSFLLDSLGPGDYQFAQVTPIDSKCSFAWKDTTILISPPNEQLQVTAASNSPICEGSTLELNGTVFPDGDITWTGPQSFFSSALEPRLDSAIYEESGIYEMIVRYGVCEQIRELDVLIAEEIEASINGQLEYCERESMQLLAEGQGDLKSFEWRGPDNIESDSQQIIVPDMAPQNEGVYQVVIDNGYCKDTATSLISILPSPTIALPEFVETDFCEPVVLKPEITGDNNVSFSWTPAEGLDCIDCPAPKLQVPFLPAYQLSVINDFLCADTATIKVSLLKDKLVYAPNAFSPNFDGFNDYFQLFPGCGLASIKKLEIVDRWGSVVFSKNEIDYTDAQVFWDGLVDGSEVPFGVYIWYAEIELVDGSRQKLFGDISLLR